MRIGCALADPDLLASLVKDLGDFCARGLFSRTNEFLFLRQNVLEGWPFLSVTDTVSLLLLLTKESKAAEKPEA